MNEGRWGLLWVVLAGWIALSVVPVQAAAWMTMETDHFRIAFEEGNEPLVQQAAYYLEHSYDTLTEQLGHEPADKTYVVLGDYSDMANGFATAGYGYNEEEYLLTYSGPNSTLRAGIDTWLHTLAIHELTHTIHIDMHAGATSLTRALFGRMGRLSLLLPDLSNPNGDLPVYLVEGFASYMETINTNGGRLRSPLWEMILRTDVAHNRLMTRDQSSGRYTYARYTGDAPYYLYGAYFCDYVARHYGQEKLFEIMRDNSKGNSFFIDGVFRRVLGESLPAVWGAFIDELKSTFEQQLAELKAQGLTESERLTRTGYTATSPAFSPDGETIVYAQSGKNNAAAIRVVKLEGGLNRTLVSANTAFSGEGFSWSFDGQKLVYNRLNFDGPKLANDLYLYDMATRQETRYTRGARASGPTWSPSGQTIVYVAKHAPLQTSLMAIDTDGSNPRMLLEGRDEMQFSSPRFSPDGRQLAVSVQRFGGFNDIVVLNADGTNLRALTQDRAMDFAPQWSPNGQYVLFNSDRTGVFNIFAYRLSDGRLFQVTNVAFGAFSPAMSPDGRQLTFINYDINGYDVHLMDANPQSWREVPLQRQPLPQMPDYAAFAKNFEIRPYSPWPTLMPHAWRPLLNGVFGALIQSEDLLNHTGYGIVAGVDINGRPQALARITHRFADYPTQSSQVAAPTMDLDLNPASLGLNLSLPLTQSINTFQRLNLSGSVGMLGMIDTETGPLVLQGVGMQGGWNTLLSVGRDGLNSVFSFDLNAGLMLTDTIGIVPFANLQGSATWTLGGDFQFGAKAQVGVLQGSGRGVLDVSFPLFQIARQLGTWPIYFQKVQITGFVGANASLDGSYAEFYGLSVGFPLYLWYNYLIQPQIGMAFVDGQWNPTFSF